MRPTILLACTNQWLAPARLAVAFVKAGCRVEVLCPAGHPVTKTRVASRIHVYRALAPLRSTAAAIATVQSDLIVPCDDLAIIHLHRLYSRALLPGGPAASRALFERSLG